MPGDWISKAVLSAAIVGMVNIIDSHLISRRMPSFRAFLMPAALVILAYGLTLSYLFPLPGNTGTWPLVVTIASCMLRAAAVTIMLYTMKREEVSRVIPVVQIYPIFVAIMAVELLGEPLHYLDWIAIIIVVAGAVTISIRRDAESHAVWLGKPFFLLVGSGLLMAMADVTAKYALDYISFWNMYWISSLCMSGVFLLISVRPQVIKELHNMKQRKSVMALLSFNETLATIGNVLSLWAIEKGLVSLVSTIISSRPMFVVIYALILSRLSPTFLNWQYGKATLVLRLVATFMIVGGIAVIYLT